MDYIIISIISIIIFEIVINLPFFQNIRYKIRIRIARISFMASILTDSKLGRMLGRILRICIDFLFFWFVLIWKDGIVLQRLLSLWEQVQDLLDQAWISIQEIPNLLIHLWDRIILFLDWLVQIIVFLSPYGREPSLNPIFRYCLDWCSWSIVFCCILLFLFLCTIDFSGSESFFAAIFFGIIAWYPCYFACHLIILIPLYFNILAAICCVVTSAIIFILTTFISLLLFDYL